jgi:hypothetical protein
MPCIHGNTLKICSSQQALNQSCSISHNIKGVGINNMSTHKRIAIILDIICQWNLPEFSSGSSHWTRWIQIPRSLYIWRARRPSYPRSLDLGHRAGRYRQARGRCLDVPHSSFCLLSLLSPFTLITALGRSRSYGETRQSLLLGCSLTSHFFFPFLF